MGGGIGAAPLYGLARRMLEAGRTPNLVLGFRSKQDAFYLEEFAALADGLWEACQCKNPGSSD